MDERLAILKVTGVTEWYAEQSLQGKGMLKNLSNLLFQALAD
ncbi:MAG: hypothetical protein NMNS01_23900 [Nitrosomonas sp.]|jgi:hypothetical protein|nr:MAG: hypothetical protein NMNS01_23900 [Nitrosomonas sp.]